jgi:hypothetical protein
MPLLANYFGLIRSKRLVAFARSLEQLDDDAVVARTNRMRQGFTGGDTIPTEPFS